MEIHRTEEEQVEAIKNWWKENGTSVVIGVALGIAAIFGVRYWFDYQKAQTQQASALYASVLESIATDKVKAEALASELSKNYSSTPYATLTALNLAKLKVDDKDLKAAQTYLQWVIDNGSDEGFRHVARIRLARLYLEEGNVQQAEQLVKGIKASGFDSEYSELRGDIFLAKGENAQAVESYRLAQTGLQPNSPRSQLLQMKIDDLAVEK
ncbi:MAG: tetratricopeptide repeat protein [Gammaproteobacteria bacterium]